MKCGQRLLARLEELDNNLAAIRTLEGRFLTGFAHGQAGIAYSLCRLYRATGDSTFLHAAKRLIAFERSSYSPTHGNWPDLRHPGLARFMPSWCHGAPGIALARVATVDVLDQAESHSEIDRALAITQERVPGDTDCVCCGKFGRVEILWTAGRVLRRAELSGQAQGLAWQSVLDARRNRDYAPALGPVGRFRCLGLFQGVAGIGYTMLRLAFPDAVPQVLLLNRATT
jgi:lantibiotic modifying enzyme